MLTHIHFTEEQKQQARQVDLCHLLRSQGERLKRSGSEYEWIHGGQKVTIRGNLWYHQYEQVGGDAIDFVRRFYGTDYVGAVEYLLGGTVDMPMVASTTERKGPTPFVLPEANGDMRRVYDYLTHHRGIHKDVLDVFVRQGLIYESAKYHNAVFVGKDLTGQPCHASLRGTHPHSSYRGNAPGSDPAYSFHWEGKSDRLYLFEAPIDLLSYICLHKENWQADSYAAACGVSDRVLFRMLSDHPTMTTVCLCLDNDPAGRRATAAISEKLMAQNKNIQVLVPARKDWNEDLILLQEENQ